MRTQIYDINLVVGAGIPPIVKVSQNDELRVLAFRLFDGIREYFPFENEEVIITGTKPSGLGFTEECSVNGSLVTVETTLAMTQESGRISAELRISDGSTNIGTANFTLYVEPAPHPAGTTDGTTEEARTVLERCEQYAQQAQEAAGEVPSQVQDLVDAAVADKMEEIEGAVQDVTDASTQAVNDINEAGENVFESIPSDYTALSAQVGTNTSAISQLQADLEDLDERIDGLGDGVPTEVRQAILALFNSAAYAETGLTDEIAVIESWAAVVTAIALNQTSISISGASTNQLVATTTPAGGTVTWASSDTSVATVSSNGLVTGVGNGTATITASCGGKNATCSVTVSGFATLTGISAVYSGTSVAEGTHLDSLKTDLVVTAIYSDSTTRTLTDYSLSGTLAKGTSTITVAYGDKTTTFNVTVTSDVDDPIVITDRTYTPGYINDSGNITSLANNYVSNMYIPFSGHIIIDYTKNRNDVTSCRLAEYDSNQTFIKRSYVTVRKTGGADSFVLDSNTAYVRVGFATTAPENVFANFEVLKNTGISNYLYYESGTIDDTGNEQTSNSRVRTGYIDLSNGTSAFKILYSSLSNAVAALKLYDSSKVYGEQIPNSLSRDAVNTETTYSFARLVLGSTSTFDSAAVANSAIVIDGTLYRLKEGGE